MSRSPLLFVTGVVLLSLGCSSFRYMKDSTPELERARQDYVVNNPGNRYNDDIAAGRVRKGMSRLQVRSTWGDPDLVEARSNTGETETWAYHEEDVSRGTSIYHLRFEGELLKQLDIERGGALLPTSDVDRREKDRREGTGTLGDTGKKPGSR